jgi:hypothetical protein
VDGYTTQTLMKDQRFRLGMALRDAGLHDTDYARDAMRRLPAGTVARPDMLTTAQKDGNAIRARGR